MPVSIRWRKYLTQQGPANQFTKKEDFVAMDTKNQNALDRFINKTRDLFASEPDLDKRWTALSPILAVLLADPEVIAASKDWPRRRWRR